jgi:rubrerythrin
MSKKIGSLQVIADLLGDDFMSDLAKAELYKPETNSTVSHEELADAMKVVPRAVMAWLTRNLADMKDGENRNLMIPFARAAGATMSLSKVTHDVYHGEVLSAQHKVLYRFKYRTIPGLGLVLLTTFELYDLEDLDKDQIAKDKESYLSSMIEERIALKSLIGQVIEEKMAQRDAIEQLIKLRMNSEIKKEAIDPAKAELTAKDSELKEYKQRAESAEIAQAEESKKETKADRLKEFIENQKKLKKNDAGYTVHLFKSEFKCPDCGQKLFDGKNMSGCLCYGSDMGRKIFLKKNENGTTTVKFSKGWNKDNIEMLLSILKGRDK